MVTMVSHVRRTPGQLMDGPIGTFFTRFGDQVRILYIVMGPTDRSVSYCQIEGGVLGSRYELLDRQVMVPTEPDQQRYREEFSRIWNQVTKML